MKFNTPLALSLAFMLALISTTLQANDLPPMTPDLKWMGRIVVEVTEDLDQLQVDHSTGLALTGIPELDDLARQFSVYNMTKLIPWAEKPENSRVRDISRYYILEYPPEIEIKTVADAFLVCPKIISADPYQCYRTDYTPNDLMFNQQWAMSRVQAALAYDYCRGSDEIIIGIVDTGTDTTHPDLRDNLWINPDEDLNHNGMIELSEWNGLDDGGNGFVDDFWGWNVLQSNNLVFGSPSESHGTHCAGDASSATDNGIGIASLGYKAKIMTALAGTSVNIGAGSQGISYCAANGAKIISCSWGGAGYNPYQQSVISNAWSLGAIVLASAGNTYSDSVRWPAAYDNVVAVAATDQNDYKADFSNWGYYVDICAPGVSVLSTVPGGSYQSWDGTSMACPIAAGLCALIWASQPMFTNQQVVDHLFATCVNIDALNPSYAGFLGHGRIDAGIAISAFYPNLSVSQYSLSDESGNNDGRPDPGETIELSATIENSSDSIRANGVVLTLTCSDPDINITQASSNLGNITPNSSANNNSDPIEFEVSATAQPHEVEFSLAVTAQGLTYLVEMTFLQMIGRPNILVVDDDGGSTYQQWYDQDLDSLVRVHDIWNAHTLGDISSAELALYPLVIWHTSNTQNPLTDTEQTLIANYLAQGNRLFLTGENIDEQLGDSAFYLNTLHAISLDSLGSGFWLDGVAGDPISDGVTLWIYNFGGGAANNLSPNAINPAGDATQVLTYSGTGQGAGIKWEGPNCRLVYFPFCFEAGSNNGTPRRQVLTNIITWLETTVSVEPGATSTLPDHFNLSPIYPNPFNATAQVAFTLPRTSQVKLEVFNLLGEKISTLADGVWAGGEYKINLNGAALNSGMYFVRLQTEQGSFLQKMVLLK